MYTLCVCMYVKFAFYIPGFLNLMSSKCVGRQLPRIFTSSKAAIFLFTILSSTEKKSDKDMLGISSICPSLPSLLGDSSWGLLSPDLCLARAKRVCCRQYRLLLSHLHPFQNLRSPFNRGFQWKVLESKSLSWITKSRGLLGLFCFFAREYLYMP